jgi:tetratricopeptide (TPR) repeat protein
VHAAASCALVLVTAVLLSFLPVAAQDKPQSDSSGKPAAETQDKSTADQPKYQEPAEEDTAENPKPKVYAFNPMQAQKELTVGNFYFKHGKYRAAQLRFEESTKWNPGFAEAWLRLGEAEEKQNDSDGMRKAFEKFLELDPQSKAAEGVRDKLRALNASAKKP